MMTIEEEIKHALKATLANEVCSAQSLDEPKDRARVLEQIMRQLRSVKMRHSNLHNAMNCELDADQEKRVRFEYC